MIELKNTNIGDSIIADTCEYLIKQADSSADITRMNLFPPQQIMKKFKHYPFRGIRFMMSVMKRLKIDSTKYNCLRWQSFIKKSSDAYNYYHSHIKNADKVIIAGGGLIKYSKEDFWNAIYTISDFCEKENKPLHLNAVGIEGYDSQNYRCMLLSESLSKENVSISTRDDLETLKKYLKKPEKAILVGDPALYTAETYKISAVSSAETIGIGVIRGKIYKDYGFDHTEQNIIKSYINLIKLLEQKNYKWQMFCNGIEDDYILALKILKALNLPCHSEYLAPRPSAPKELISIISQYKGVIAARLHANIISTSLNIPSVGLIWNDKLKLFGKIIGCEKRFIDKEMFMDAKYVLTQLEEAIVDGYNHENIQNLKNLTFLSLKNFID